MPRLVTTAGAALLACALPASAHAEPLGLEVAAQAGFGTGVETPPAPAVGARAGASIASLYFGVAVVEYFGSTKPTAPPTNGPGAPTSSTSASLGVDDLLYGIALGYDIKPLAPLTLRPQVGAGLARVSCSDHWCGGDVSYPYVEPGATVLLALGKYVFVGVDVNLLVVAVQSAFTPKNAPASLTMHGQLGVRF
ncbi:MAG TPA: hypothetical protein VGL81_28105 [Polyangiaceae bacterium]|jgi:hypothetical protein